MAKYTTVGDVASSCTVAETMLATESHDRRLLRNVAGIPLVATTTPTASVTTADTTTLANPNTIINKVAQAVALLSNSVNMVLKATARRRLLT